jgi:hypothetical protein
MSIPAYNRPDIVGAEVQETDSDGFVYEGGHSQYGTDARRWRNTDALVAAEQAALAEAQAREAAEAEAAKAALSEAGMCPCGQRLLAGKKLCGRCHEDAERGAALNKALRDGYLRFTSEIERAKSELSQKRNVRAPRSGRVPRRYDSTVFGYLLSV